jgi:SAM-dependent methyltransferase
MTYLERSLDRYEQTLKAANHIFQNYSNPLVYDVGGYDYFRQLIIKYYKFKYVYDISSKDLNTEKINKPSGLADIIFLAEVIEHLYNPDLVIAECRRLLKNDGYLVLTTPNLTSWFNRILFIFGFFPMNMDISCQLRYSGRRDILNKAPVDKVVKFNPLFDVHIRLYTVKSLTILLEEHGFIVENIHGYYQSKSLNFKVGKFLNLINRNISRFPTFAHGIILTAKAK